VIRHCVTTIYSAHTPRECCEVWNNSKSVTLARNESTPDPQGIKNTMNAYLQRADDFILQQIYRFEQKKQGRDYREMPNSPQHSRQQPTRAQTYTAALPNGASLPQGWLQQYDPQSQRWYYVDQSTGRSQWEPPVPSRGCCGPRSSSHQPSHSGDEQIARRLQDEEDARARTFGRSSSHMSRPQSGHLSVPQQQRPVTSSPHPSPHGRLPPGAHLDIKTGQIVTNMFPPDHPMNAH
jgi:hypothetical protein